MEDAKASQDIAETAGLLTCWRDLGVVGTEDPLVCSPCRRLSLFELLLLQYNHINSFSRLPALAHSWSLSVIEQQTKLEDTDSCQALKEGLFALRLQPTPACTRVRSLVLHPHTSSD